MAPSRRKQRVVTRPNAQSALVQNGLVAYVDRERWAQEVRRPDWYLHLRDEYLDLLARARTSPRETAHVIADEVYGFFEEALEQQTIALAPSGPAWDAQRQPVDTVVIHHTALEPGITMRRIEAIHLTRIYASYYTNPAPADKAIRGTGIQSGHLRNGRQVFYCYHWLVRPDGQCERLLEDHETGWHAGNWDVNCRSVGICLDANLTDHPPTPEALAAIQRVLGTHYQDVSVSRIFGHREINSSTTCPGNRFLGGWKQAIIDASPRPKEERS